MMEGIYVHTNEKHADEAALYYGLIVFTEDGDYRVVAFHAYTWGQMIMLAEEAYNLKMHPNVFFCAE